MKRTVVLLLVFVLLLSSFPFTGFAAKKDFKYNGTVVGKIDDNGRIVLSKEGARSCWTSLVQDNKERTIVLPKMTLQLYGVIRIGNNKKIIAKGTTVIQNNIMPIMMNESCKLNYKSTKNVTIDGGTWKIKDLAKSTQSTSNFRLAHASNLKFKNMTVETNNFSHAFELIACKNVTVEKCKLTAKGKKNKSKKDEVLQIDVASPDTAPTEARFGKKFVNGQTCKNITVKKCKIKGGMGICTNKNDKFISKHHKKIKILNNKITSYTQEALCLHNAAGVTVKGNKIICKSKDPNYSLGCYLLSCGKFKKLSKYKNVFKNNTVKGGIYGLYISSDNGVKYGKTIVKNNHCYAKRGKKYAFCYNCCPKIKLSKNTKAKW